MKWPPLTGLNRPVAPQAMTKGSGRDAQGRTDGLPVFRRAEEVRIYGVVNLDNPSSGEHAAFFHFPFQPEGGRHQRQGRYAGEGAALAGEQPRRKAAEEAGSAELGATAAAFVPEPVAVHGAVAPRGAGKHVVQRIDQRAADVAQPREIHRSAAYPVQVHQVGFLHLSGVEPHAQHVQGEGQVPPSFRQQGVKSMRQMAAQRVRSSSGGGSADFQAVYSLAPPEQKDGFHIGNIPVQGIIQPVGSGAGRYAVGDLEYCPALRRSHIGEYED